MRQIEDIDVRCGDASCQGSLMMLLWFRVMISIRASFSADTLAGPPRPRPPPRPPRPPSRPCAGGCAGACASAVALMPAAAATVKKSRRFIGRLLILLRELVRDVRQNDGVDLPDRRMAVHFDRVQPAISQRLGEPHGRTDVPVGARLDVHVARRGRVESLDGVVQRLLVRRADVPDVHVGVGAGCLDDLAQEEERRPRRFAGIGSVAGGCPPAWARPRPPPVPLVSAEILIPFGFA